MGIAATVTHAPANADDLLDVQWTSPRDGQDGEEVVRERDLRWVSTSRLPAVGDDALLFVDSQGDPWAFVWATGSTLDAGTDARLDALEAPVEAMRYIGGAGNPAFASPWVNFDSGLATPSGLPNRDAGFWKDRDGMVRLVGVVKSGSTGTSVFTLPTGYRPGRSDASFITPCGGGAAFVSALSSGNVQVTAYLGSPNVTSFCFLDGVVFRAGA
jgi:hypothetical protein